jgi:hypothetical protein
MHAAGSKPLKMPYMNQPEALQFDAAVGSDGWYHF